MAIIMPPLLQWQLTSQPHGQVLIKSCHLIEPVVSSLLSVVSAQAISYRQPTTAH
jgi:hypothetical protein